MEGRHASRVSPIVALCILPSRRDTSCIVSPEHIDAFGAALALSQAGDRC